MPSRLFVYVPATGQTTQCWAPLIDRLRREPGLEDADWLPWDHYQKWYSTGRMERLSATLAARIDERYLSKGPFDHVTLIGHSLGGILVRKAYLIGSGCDETVPCSPMEWGARVDRIVLLAAINRGFDPNYLWWGRLAKAILLMPCFRLARDYMVGSDVITDLRISWIRRFRQLGDRQPTVIQVQGSRDELIRHDDSVDVEQFARAGVERIDATHRDLPLLPPDRADERYAVLKRHILTTQGTADSPNTEDKVRDVVFLVHGIRATTSDWPERARALVAEDYPGALPVPAGYTYFSALQFAIPMLRRKQIRWLQDTYSYHFAKHQAARFHYVGHSFGTYLLGRSLEKVPSIRFERVALAGSVLPQQFDWQRHLGTRVGALRNHRANGDVPVAILCSLLRGFGMSDVGTGGFGGFLNVDPSYCRELFYYAGGHGAALSDKERLKALVDFVTTGTDRYAGLKEDEPGTIATVSRALGHPVIAYSALLLLLGILAVIAIGISKLAPVRWEYIFAMLVFLIGLVLSFI
jgi:pimeloyl-ACP methyl ester carboxylesterase